MGKRKHRDRDEQPRALDDLDAAQTLAAVEAGVLHRRAAEVEDLELVGRWADLHGADPHGGPGTDSPFGDRLIHLGGEGTPGVQELCLNELAVAQRVSVLRTRSMTAEVLDLRHRLPRIWALTQQLQVEPWLARKVSSATRHLDQDTAAWVDGCVARVAADLPPGRVLALVEAKIIEADPDGHAARVAKERERRYVALGRTDEAGLRHVIARISAGDAVWIDAMVDRVADILAARFPEGTSRDVLRAEAFGWLARPAELLELLLTAARDADAAAETEAVIDTGPEESSEWEPEEPAGSRATDLSAWAIEALRSLDPAKLRPQAVLYLHLHQSVLAGDAQGAVRVEDLGAIGLEQLIDLLQHAHVTCRPVIDLADQVAVDSYECPESIRERIRLTNPTDYFPYATTASRRLDLDHVVPFDRHGPPGQTGTHNLGPLGRRHHRGKTFAGYQVRQLGPGRYLWRTPHSRYFIVDGNGTHPIDPGPGEELLQAG